MLSFSIFRCDQLDHQMRDMYREMCLKVTKAEVKREVLNGRPGSSSAIAGERGARGVSAGSAGGVGGKTSSGFDVVAKLTGDVKRMDKRIENKKFPKFTSVGSGREDDSTGTGIGAKLDLWNRRTNQGSFVTRAGSAGAGKGGVKEKVASNGGKPSFRWPINGKVNESAGNKAGFKRGMQF